MKIPIYSMFGIIGEMEDNTEEDDKKHKKKKKKDSEESTSNKKTSWKKAPIEDLGFKEQDNVDK